MIYKLPNIISKKALYNQILPELTKQYRYLEKGDRTAVSLVQATRIDANAIPLFMGMLNLLYSKTGNPVYLELTYGSDLIGFLDTIGFFNKMINLGIIEYDEDCVGGYIQKETSLHKVDERFPILDYEDMPKEEKEEIRDCLSEKLKYEVVAKFVEILSRQRIITSDEERDVLSITITEILLNSELYSLNMSYIYLQDGIVFSNKKKGYILSVADIGKGFYESLSKKIEKKETYSQDQRDSFYQYAKSLGINLKEEKNFLSIMEALYYSQLYSELKSRKMNLFRLKNLLANSHANLRIHQRNREVVFTYKTCHGCKDRNIIHCVKCLWQRNKKDDQKFSPIKAYPVVMSGVHIDVEFILEK